jgi:hypothetical protein
MAYGSRDYKLYYMIFTAVYLITGLGTLGVYFSIYEQCKAVCPVASQLDLTTDVGYETRAGLDEKYLLPKMRWPVGNATPSVTTATNRLDTAGGLYAADGEPHHIGLFTHMFACNMTERLGGPDWYNKTIKEQWTAARAAGRGDSLSAEGDGAKTDYWPEGLTFAWEDKPNLCYVCCDPTYVTEYKRCRPSVTKNAPFVPCETATTCESGFKPATNFPIPSSYGNSNLMTMAHMFLAIAYILLGVFSGAVTAGFCVYEKKYELDFKEENMSTCDRLCGCLAKGGPFFMRYINLGLLALIGFEVMTVTSGTCYDAHDQFGNFTFYNLMQANVFAVAALCVTMCGAGTWFRSNYHMDPAFHSPPQNPDPVYHGRSTLDLCCHDCYCSMPKNICCPCGCCYENDEDGMSCGGCECGEAIKKIIRNLCWCFRTFSP